MLSFSNRLILGSVIAAGFAVSAQSAIIVDGINRGSNFTLTSSANTIFLTAAGDDLTISTSINGGLTIDAVADSNVLFNQGNIGNGLDFTGGDLTIARNANINGGLSVRDGNVLINGVNLNGGIDLFAGIVTLDADPNVNINGSINATGGGLFAENVSNLNSQITFSGDAVGFFSDDARNINSRLTVDEDASVFFSDPRNTSTGTDPDGRVSDSVGRITGLGNNINFRTTPERNLFVGANRSDAEDAIAARIPAAVPEPTRALTALLGLFAVSFARRRK